MYQLTISYTPGKNEVTKTCNRTLIELICIDQFVVNNVGTFPLETKQSLALMTKTSFDN